MQNISAIIVEPDYLWRGLLFRHLDHAAGKYFFATNARDALRSMKHAEPVLLVTELRLPDVSGLKLIGWIRDQPFSATKIMVISAGFKRSELEQGLALGVGGFLEKGLVPIDRIASFICSHLTDRYH